MKYPRRLSSGANNTVIVLSDTEVAKLFTGDTRSDIGSEAEKMKIANSINELVVRFIRLDYSDDLQAEMLRGRPCGDGTHSAHRLPGV
ncbi:hypothetical protein GCM10027578_29640 [Spirosoma luteolum]